MESEVESTQCNIGSPSASAHWERYFKVQTSQRPAIIIHCRKHMHLQIQHSDTKVEKKHRARGKWNVSGSCHSQSACGTAAFILTCTCVYWAVPVYAHNWAYTLYRSVLIIRQSISVISTFMLKWLSSARNLMPQETNKCVIHYFSE